MINVYAEIPSVADWIVVSLTACGVLIALIGLIFAIIKVNNWKKEKEWDTIIEAKAYASFALDYVVFYFGPSTIINPTVSKSLLAKSIEENDRFATKFHQELIDKHQKFFNTNETIKSIYEKLDFTCTNRDNVVLDYYKMIANLLEKAEQINRERAIFRVNPISYENVVTILGHLKKQSKDETLKLQKLDSDFFSLYFLNINKLQSKLILVQNYRKQKKLKFIRAFSDYIKNLFSLS